MSKRPSVIDCEDAACVATFCYKYYSIVRGKRHPDHKSVVYMFREMGSPEWANHLTVSIFPRLQQKYEMRSAFSLANIEKWLANGAVQERYRDITEALVAALKS